VAGVNAAGERIIAHNEDGFPQLRDECLLATITPSRGLSFTSFAYPGSICGHTFAVNEKGIVNTVNNIRAVHRPQGLPRQILARASLNANTLDEAITILTGQPRSGRFTIRSGSWAMRGCSALRPPVKAVPFYPDDGNRACQPSGACGTGWR
jgi:hypothetical protein